jgi:hypothetical protein
MATIFTEPTISPTRTSLLVISIVLLIPVTGCGGGGDVTGGPWS